MNRDKTAERRHRRAIRAYGEEACRTAYTLHLCGNGARTVALEGPVTIRTTQQADAAINAGRWLNDQGCIARVQS